MADERELEYAPGDPEHEALAASIPEETVKAAESWYSMHGHGLVRNILAGAIPLIRVAERERFRVVLCDHYLMNVICDPERKLDNPVCGCSRVFLGWHPSIGAARDAWIDHVLAIIGSEEENRGREA